MSLRHRVVTVFSAILLTLSLSLVATSASATGWKFSRAWGGFSPAYKIGSQNHAHNLLNWNSFKWSIHTPSSRPGGKRGGIRQCHGNHGHHGCSVSPS